MAWLRSSVRCGGCVKKDNAAVPVGNAAEEREREEEKTKSEKRKAGKRKMGKWK
jgi:hypothetical protein